MVAIVVVKPHLSNIILNVIGLLSPIIKNRVAKLLKTHILLTRNSFYLQGHTYTEQEMMQHDI